MNENPYFNNKVIENCRVHFILDDLNFKISYYISHGLSRCNVNTKTGDVNCVPAVHQFSFSFQMRSIFHLDKVKDITHKKDMYRIYYF